MCQPGSIDHPLWLATTRSTVGDGARLAPGSTGLEPQAIRWPRAALPATSGHRVSHFQWRQLRGAMREIETVLPLDLSPLLLRDGLGSGNDVRNVRVQIALLRH